MGAVKVVPQSVKLDVIVPVYKGLEETMRCLYSVCAAKQATNFDLVVINDHSPDPELVRQLNFVADLGLIDLHRNTTNLGFVGTVNYGMRLHPDRDVLLLNSDTEVYGSWLDKICAHAHSSQDIGTVTPLSNNAEICSYPHFIKDNNYELEITGAEIDQLAGEINPGFATDAPTGVGFCMFIKRDCLSKVGYFDEATFGRGYGEENDFCQRAILAGYRNSILTDTYVRHYGSTSFGSEKSDRIQEAMQKLQAKHPHYHSSVADFIIADPLSSMRKNIDLQRIRYQKVPVFLFVTHNWGGGTERHVQDMKKSIEENGEALVLVARPKQSSPDVLYIDDTRYPNLGEFGIKENIAQFVRLLSGLSIKLIHVHQLVGSDIELSDFIRAASLATGVPYDFTVHDYYTYCPRIHLWDQYQDYCGEPEPAACEVCCNAGGYLRSLGGTSVWRWRQRSHDFLRGARRVFVPNPDVRARLKRQFSGIEPVVKEHIEPHLKHLITDIQVKKTRNKTLKIALLGAIGVHKGSKLLSEVAREAKLRSLGVEFVVIGYTDRDELLKSYGNVKITGPYSDSDLQSILALEGPDIVWMSSIWPETYSYTLSEVMANGHWPVAFDFGAVAERIKRTGQGSVMDINLMLAPDLLLEELIRQCCEIPCARLEYKPIHYPNFVKHYYELV